MDAIRKKMQSLKAETEQLYATIAAFEEATREATARADQVRTARERLVITLCLSPRLIVISETWERRFRTSRSDTMRPTTS